MTAAPCRHDVTVLAAESPAVPGGWKRMPIGEVEPCVRPRALIFWRKRRPIIALFAIFVLVGAYATWFVLRDGHSLPLPDAKSWQCSTRALRRSEGFFHANDAFFTRTCKTDLAAVVAMMMGRPPPVRNGHKYVDLRECGEYVPANVTLCSNVQVLDESIGAQAEPDARTYSWLLGPLTSQGGYDWWADNFSLNFPTFPPDLPNETYVAGYSINAHAAADVEPQPYIPNGARAGDMLGLPPIHHHHHELQTSVGGSLGGGGNERFRWNGDYECR